MRIRRAVTGTVVGMTRGADEPDRRGRTGLHLTGLDLDRNPDVVVRDVELLASNWHVLRTTTFDERGADGTWTTKHAETYDRGNGATILLYDLSRRTVLLTRQFRYAGLRQRPSRRDAARDRRGTARCRRRRDRHPPRGHAKRPGTSSAPPARLRRLHEPRLRHRAGPLLRGTLRRGDPAPRRRRLADEGEQIELVELGIDEAVAAIGGDIVDGKTIMLLQWAVLNGPFAR